MKKLIFILIVTLNFSCVQSQENQIDRTKVKEDLNEILIDISQNYIYLDEKNVDLDCIQEHYETQIENLNTEEETVLFFEYLLDEFYDSHLILNTNRNSSFRLFSPIYIKIENGKAVISNIWQTQIQNIDQNLIGAEVQKINGMAFDKAIEQFPTHCNDKKSKIVREWIANKILAGRYNQPRVLTLKLENNNTVEFDLDKVKIKQTTKLLTSTIENDIGIITINNSLGNSSLINEFDKTLDKLINTKGLIIDLRNTVDGGDSYIARGIMGRFINELKPYQRHLTNEQYGENPIVKRSWVEYVSPRGKQYKKSVIVLVGRWTGSMGEGLAIGFDGMERAEIVGTEMERLAGEMNGFSFKHQNYGYRLSTAKLYHVNGTPREKYIPANYVKQTTLEKDEILDKGIYLLTSSQNKTDSILKKEIELIGTEDQTLRLLLPQVTEKFGRESNEFKYIWSLINRQDSICLNKLIKILDTHGWVGKSKVGEKANQAIWLIIQHSELNIQEKYLPLLKESVEKGESEGWHLAFLKDRVLMRNKQKQLYGTQAVWDKTLQKNKIYPIEDLKNVNQRRKKLGLESIEKFAESNGYIFNQNE